MIEQIAIAAFGLLSGRCARLWKLHTAIKAKYLQRVEAHRIADEIVQGTGFEKNGRIRACTPESA